VLLRKASQQAESATKKGNGNGNGRGDGPNGNGNGNGSNGQGVAGLRNATDALYAGRKEQEKRTWREQADSPPCPVCGTLTVRSGTCYKCLNCGATTGCS
jgi:ribonucleoside-diphosphate reductase alpha chain